MSFPNPDNYARDCDCGTAGANATPPPVAIQAEIDSLDTRVTALEETNDVIVSSGGIDALTTAQQVLIREGSIVVTTDGKRWVYSGAGSKVLEASYIELSDLTIGSTANLPLITGAGGVITAGSFGSSANTFCQGDDSRLSDARTPLSHTHGNISNGGLIGTTANLPIITGTGGLLQAGSFGTTTNTFCQGNDVRVNHVRPLGTNNVFVGNTALSSGSLSGGSNTAVGAGALLSNISGRDNTACGFSSLGANTSGIYNTGCGSRTLIQNTIGNNNTALGKSALELNETGSSNTASGSFCLAANVNGQSNTGVGAECLRFNQSGNFNTASGAFALAANITGVDNTASGFLALRNNRTGNGNSAFGTSALFLTTTGFRNSAFGSNALNYAIGSDNVAVGYEAGTIITGGSFNTMLGWKTNVNSGAAINRIAIGAGAVSQADGEVAIGSVTNPVLTAGTAGAITTYLVVRINGTQYKMPLYAI